MEVVKFAPKSTYNETIVVKQATLYCKLAHNRIATLQFKKVKSPKQPCFTLEQIELLLANADTWVMTMYTTLAFTGIRIDELERIVDSYLISMFPRKVTTYCSETFILQ